MKTFTRKQLEKDWCEQCVYSDLCDKSKKEYCDNVEVTDEQIEYLGKILYGSNAKFVKE